MKHNTIPSFTDILVAYEKIRKLIHRTPVFTSEGINKLCKAELYFKCENFQKVGAFKFRGATNAIANLSMLEMKQGVATHSSGNHAAALSLAAKLKGISAHIVMPENSKEIKKIAVQEYGGKITFCKPTLQARIETLQEIVKQTGAVEIHPFDNFYVIAGQGTAALELMREKDELDIVITPVGGGGLLSGTALAVKGMCNTTKVYGAEPLGADDAFKSFYSGNLIPQTDPKTMADGLLTSLSERTFHIISSLVDNIFTATETSIAEAMKIIWQRMKIIVEPSSAVPLATILENKNEFEGKRIGIILSGGNVDLQKLPF